MSNQSRFEGISLVDCLNVHFEQRNLLITIYRLWIVSEEDDWGN